MRLFFLFLLFYLTQNEGQVYRFEGIYPEPDGDQRFFLIRLFTPYNPTILAYNCTATAPIECAKWWPQGTFFTEAALTNYAHKFQQTDSEPHANGTEKNDLPINYDVLWIESDGQELQILSSLSPFLPKVRALYTPTHFSEASSFSNLKLFLESSGFALLSHWYWEGNKGNAIFIKKEIFNAAMRTLNFSPGIDDFVNTPSSYPLQPLFNKLNQKSKGHDFGAIDYIYMINLDERPEKFAQAIQGLQHYGIVPDRFPAVNGWNLSLATLEQIGLKAPPHSLKGTFMGSIYYDVNGTLYRSHELIREDQKTYFSMGLSQGSIGIVLSHLSVLQDAYDSDYQMIWVMEDDIEVLEDPQKLLFCIKELNALDPDWDILFTDTDTKDTKGNHVPCRALATRPNFCTEILDNFLKKFYPISPNLQRIGMRYGAYSMIIRRSGIEKILNYFKTYGVFLPYDMDFWLIPGIRMYSVTKDLISHSAGALTDNNYPNYLKK